MKHLCGNETCFFRNLITSKELGKSLGSRISHKHLGGWGWGRQALPPIGGAPGVGDWGSNQQLVGGAVFIILSKHTDIRVFQVALRGGKFPPSWGVFLLGGMYLRRSEFGYSNLFQS